MKGNYGTPEIKLDRDKKNSILVRSASDDVLSFLDQQRRKKTHTRQRNISDQPKKYEVED